MEEQTAAAESLGQAAPGGYGETISVVVPAYNEEQVLPEFHSRLAAVLDSARGAAPSPSDAEILRSGAVVVWQINKQDAPGKLPVRLAGLESRFPRLKIESP